MAKSNFPSVVDLFPDRELAIRRLALNDGEFRALCEDHGASQAAAQHWARQGKGDRAEEYRQLSSGIEDQIRRHLVQAEAAAPERSFIPQDGVKSRG